MIWAMAENRVIGRDNGLPWRLPDDLKHFMRTTMGKPVVMGRKTFESMKSPLPGRANIVVTRDGSWHRTGAEVTHCLDDAVACAQQRATENGVDEIMIIGGAEIYKLGLPLADRLYITLVHANVEGDVVFPDFDLSDWTMIEEEKHAADERHDHAFTIAVYQR